jgi:HD-GYP domain-containing protein (c-di-GMP phosphodiesterase class II)
MPVMLLELPESIMESVGLSVGASSNIEVRHFSEKIVIKKADGFDLVITYDKHGICDIEKFKERALRSPKTCYLVFSPPSRKYLRNNVENLMIYEIPDNGINDETAIKQMQEKGLFFLEAFRHFRSCNRNLQERLTELNKIGIALSSEQDLNHLLHMILKEVRKFTRADAGSLYIKDGDELVFKVAQNDTIDKHSNGNEREFTQFRIPISSKSFAGYVAQTMKPLNITDASEIPSSAPYQHDTSFDQKFDYKTESILTFPMKDTKGELVGILQLINALDEKGHTVPFGKTLESLVESMGSQAAVAIKNAALIEDINRLLMSLIEYSSALIDARSSHTSGHSKRVAHLVIEIAMLINKTQKPPFDKIKFNREEMQELYFAALLHDIGKIGVPESVLDKKTRLSECKIESLFWKIKFLVNEMEKEVQESGIFSLGNLTVDSKNLKATVKQLKKLWSQVKDLNRTDILTDEIKAAINQISDIRFHYENSEYNLLNDEEKENILIKAGNLTDKEREIIKNHINLTIDTLEKIPFPRHLAGVPYFAGQHHERLDGSGYPRGLSGNQIPLQSRILAIADYIDALSSQDRPYRKGLSLSKSIEILIKDAKKGSLDISIVQLFKESVESGTLQIPWYKI